MAVAGGGGAVDGRLAGYGVAGGLTVNFKFFLMEFDEGEFM